MTDDNQGKRERERVKREAGYDGSGMHCLANKRQEQEPEGKRKEEDVINHGTLCSFPHQLSSRGQNDTHVLTHSERKRERERDAGTRVA